MNARTYKDSVYGELARVGKALSSPARIELLDLLAQAPRTVEALAGMIGQSVANTSQHLQVLKGARLVEVEREGTFKRYRLATPEVAALSVAFRAAGAARLLEIEEATRTFFAGGEAVDRVDLATLRARLDAGEVTLLDVRPAEEYAAGHLPGAVGVPASELAARIAELPAGRDVVAYCRGPWCVMAVDAVRTLRASGVRAWRLEEGVADWVAEGGQVEVGHA
jgi:rhodanese-related sulfurtransferase/DNA-binding transcriptional ArsR family regulator